MIGELEAVAADWFRGLAKRHKTEIPEGAVCANCGETLRGPWCHACGQNSNNHRRSILHLFWEAIEGLLHLDGRLWRTLPALFFRPGKLARDYLDGRMARHVPPFRTFLVALLLLIFAAESAAHTLRQDELRRNQARAAVLATPQGRAAEALRIRTEAVKEHTEALAEIANDHAGDLKGAQTDAERARVERHYQSQTALAERLYARGLARADAAASGIAAPPANPINVETRVSDKRGGGDKWFKEGISKAAANPEYYLTVVFDWAHRVAVLLLPIVGLSLAGVYFYKKGYYLYDHLLVAMNLLSFSFLTNALGLILPLSLWPYWFGLVALWTPVNLFQTLRGAYHSSIVGALVKTLVVWFVTVVTFATLMVLLLLFSLSRL